VRRVAAVAVAAGLVAGCGGDGRAETPRLIVSAASSLQKPLAECSRGFEGADVRLSFAGSDDLAAQIRQGVKPDVYAAANTKLPEELAREGLLREPREFATNELVVGVRPGSPVKTLSDVGRPGAKVAIGSDSVPIGSYTRELLKRLPAGAGRSILANVRTEEPDAKGIVGKLMQRAVDAGFVYATDVRATGSELRAIALPAEAEPTVVYGAGVVEGAGPEAERYVDELLDGPCAAALRAAGFGAP
jgi:molybdate transport system substrate-binding protein